MNKFRLTIFAPIWLALIIDSMGYTIVYPVMTLIFTSSTHPILPPGTSVALRNFYLGFGYLLYPLTMFFGASIMGDLSDRIGRKKVLLIAILGFSLSFLLMGIGTEFDSLLLLFLGRALSGLFAGSQPTAQAAIADLSPLEEKKRNFSVMTFVISLGTILGPIFGGFFADEKLSSYFSFATPFYFVALVGLLNFFWLFWKFPETYVPYEHKKIDFLRPLKIFSKVFLEKQVFQIALIFFLMQIGFSTFYQLIQVRMAIDFGYTALHLGLFNTGLGICFTLAMWISLKYILKIFHEGTIGLTSLFLTALFLILCAFFRSQILVILFGYLAAGFDMVAYAMMMTAFSHAASSEKQGWVMGVFGAILALSWVLTGFSTNLLTLISSRAIINLGGISMLISALLLFFYAKKYLKRPTP